MKSILIIEDEENIAQAERIILENEFNVVMAKDGEQGMKLAKDLKPDLIVLDLMLPKRGGYDLCYHFRQDDELKDMKILMVTAKNLDVDKDKGRLVGADHYLTKPFEPAQLLLIVKQLLG